MRITGSFRKLGALDASGTSRQRRNAPHRPEKTVARAGSAIRMLRDTGQLRSVRRGSVAVCRPGMPPQKEPLWGRHDYQDPIPGRETKARSELPAALAAPPEWP